MQRVVTSIFVWMFLVTTMPLQGQSVSDRESKIKDAERAAPASITGKATVMDWDGTVLREGTDEWTCYPSMPNARADNPMCLDEQWMKWLHAYTNQEEPEITAIGMGYMLVGGEPNSNLDPFAEGPTGDNQWMEEVKPHLMILFPDPDMYDGISSNPDNGGPWVMFPDTPYAHIMMPVE